MTIYSKISNITLCVSALVAFIVLFQHAQWRLGREHLLVALLVLLPYLICWGFNLRLLHAEGLYPSVLAAAFSVIVLLFTAFAYGSMYLESAGSTSALAFFSVPLYILVATALVPGIASLLLHVLKNQ